MTVPLLVGAIVVALIALAVYVRHRHAARPHDTPLTDEQAAAEHARPYVRITVTPGDRR